MGKVSVSRAIRYPRKPDHRGLAGSEVLPDGLLESIKKVLEIGTRSVVNNVLKKERFNFNPSTLIVTIYRPQKCFHDHQLRKIYLKNGHKTLQL